MTGDPGPKPYQRKEILVDGIETSYLEAGSGKPVVLLHGGEFGGEAEACWEATIPALAEHFRVIAPDLLGFGHTAKVIDFVDGRLRRVRHLARFLEIMRISGAPCVGNSMGGMLLLFDAASEHPLLHPQKIVTISGGGALEMESPHTIALFDYDGSVEGMRKIVTALFHDKKWYDDDAYLERRRASSLLPGAWEAVSAARFRRPVELQQARAPSAIDYSRIATDTLIIAGEQDKIKPYGWWEELTSQMAKARVLLVAEAGHCSQLEQPDEVNRALIAFLGED
ncbi:alpha/beta fold hydrolase [Sphingobium subterraneum]|uniref:Pimeloyl-ACP methyl ester carboxylesterase n=1 Tax=Sphingobium subterraneum TaxID=627688 RepID=A0A841J4U3_9SPHN|nr:alpha/beta hydrolase [Sphingobium subterraneum]MBB6125362.1 pimeloyl-ACP methyl ester carboxylesterase [Sphingobium subterraneum]